MFGFVQDRSGKYLLDFAQVSEKRALEAVCRILASGPLDIDAPVNSKGWSLLTNVCGAGQIQAARYLISSGANPDGSIPCSKCIKGICQDHSEYHVYKSSPLFAASVAGRLNVVRWAHL